jgi:surface antigen
VYNLCFHVLVAGEAYMYQQAGLFLYKSRFLFAGVFTIAVLLLTSAFITATGSNTILDPKAHPSIDRSSTSMSDSPNAITAGTSELLEDIRVASLAVGRAIYQASHSVTTASAQTGKSMMQTSATAIQGTWDGLTFVGQGIGKGTMFVLHIPGKILASMPHAHAVDNMLRPSNDTKVPAINGQTSAEMLDRYNEQQRQQIASLLAAQVTANEDLRGTIIAGDPNHGGYPAKWANARQDSLLDSWGMYNRECVSYAAWKVHQTFGYMPYWGGVGNANQWVRNAKRAGIPTGSIPKVHSVAISMQGYYGHAMWVEAVRGSMIYVSQYNYDLRGRYSEMWVNGNNFTYLYFR